jgi:hypothetical protein
MLNFERAYQDGSKQNNACLRVVGRAGYLAAAEMKLEADRGITDPRLIGAFDSNFRREMGGARPDECLD